MFVLSGFIFNKGFQTNFPEYKHKTNLNYLELNAGVRFQPFKFLSFNAGGYFQVLLTDLYIMILAQKTLFASLGLSINRGLSIRFWR